MPLLHSYQQTAVSNVLQAFNTHKSVMLQMPTGTGKTHVFCEVISQVNKRTLILVHTRELVMQIHERLLKFGIRSGIIMAGKALEPTMMVQIASIQTITRRELKLWPKNVSLIVIDEAHHATAQSYQTILQHYNNPALRLLGVTATPYRRNNTGFKGTFETLLTAMPMKKFIEQGYLSGFRHLATADPQLGNIKVDALTDDYDLTELGRVMSEETVMADLIESYQKHGNNQQCIVFAVNRYHSKVIVERYKSAGITAAYIDSKTPAEERKAIITKFKAKEIQVLSNVQIFTEGFDCPDISVVQLARPTRSLVLYMQMVGRGLRKKQDGGTALILDNAGLWKRFGLVTRNRKWRLEGVEECETAEAIKSDSDEVFEEEPKNVVEADGLEMQEIAAVLTKEEKVVKPKKSIGLNALLLQNNKVVKTFEVKKQSYVNLFPLVDFLNNLLETQQPEEIVLTISRLSIPDDWEVKLTWVAAIEAAFQKHPLKGFLEIGWEETDSQLFVRFAKASTNVYKLNGIVWKKIVLR